MTPLLVGLDVGTTASKAVVFDTAGCAVAGGRADATWVRTAHGAEIDARAITATAVAALGQALAAAPEGQVLGVGVTGMGESGVLLDSTGSPLTPVIAWHDTRDTRDVVDLVAAVGPVAFARRTGLPLRGQWSLTKHRWLLVHDPRAKQAVRRLNVAEWVVRALGGDEASEQSLASRTGWLDLGSRRWWADGLAWSGASDSLLPELCTAGTPLGRVAAGTGIDRLTGAVLTVAGHDHQVAAVGAGAVRPGDELDSCGTAEALVRTVPTGLDPESVVALAQSGITTGWHVLADRWCLLGGTQGGLALQRVLDLLGLSRNDVGRLDRASRSSSGGLTVSGVDTESLAIGGVAGGAGPGDLWLSAVDAVTEAARGIHAAMSAVAGGHRALVVTGGWTGSEALLAAKRAAFGRLSTPAVREAGARGAAMLSGLAAGVFERTEDFPCPD